MDGSYANSGNGRYIGHKNYADNPERYVRAYEIIQQDILKLFEYIEPSDQNLRSFSYRTHELLMRSCIEFEANCKSILLKNGYESPNGKNMTIEDYKLIEHSHKLSKYEIKAPHWIGSKNTFKPFEHWKTGCSYPLPWYTAYNNTKHDRTEKFHEATFQQMLNAAGGLVTILTAQFRNEDFHSQGYFTAESASEFEHAIGGYFLIRYPSSLPFEERYDFNWNELKTESEPFEKFNYNALLKQNQICPN